MVSGWPTLFLKAITMIQGVPLGIFLCETLRTEQEKPDPCWARVGHGTC